MSDTGHVRDGRERQRRAAAQLEAARPERRHGVEPQLDRLQGVDLAALDAEAWRGRVAAGYQDFVRFQLVARASIGVGDLAAVEDADAVLAAIYRAGARDLLARFTDGLETQLGRDAEDGVELSGGQWQKVARARAMMRRRLLLLIPGRADRGARRARRARALRALRRSARGRARDRRHRDLRLPPLLVRASGRRVRGLVTVRPRRRTEGTRLQWRRGS